MNNSNLLMCLTRNNITNRRFSYSLFTPELPKTNNPVNEKKPLETKHYKKFKKYFSESTNPKTNYLNPNSKLFANKNFFKSI